MLKLIRDTMVQSEGYLGLYFMPDWKAVSNRGRGREAILADLHHDHSSFGHDIETAFLLVEASEVLYGETDPRTLEVASQMMEHTLDHGFDKEYFGLFYEGYAFPGEDTIAIVNPAKIWWAQAEAWHALGLFADHFPDEARYQYGYRQMWQYFEGIHDYDEMIFRGVVATRQLAKRQMTWLRSWQNLRWLKTGDKENLQHILTSLS